MTWWTIPVIGLLTFAIRAVFVLLPPSHRIERLRPALLALPIAVMPVLATSSLIASGIDPSKVVGVIVAAIVALTTRSTAGAMAAGLVAFWIGRALTSEM